MTVHRLPLAILVAAAAGSAPALGVAPGLPVDGASTTIGIHGYVPVICHARVSADSAPVEAGTASLGQLREFCNNPRGYRVLADYSPSLAHAKILVDGVPVPLQKDGTTVISRSNRAAMDTRNLALELPKRVEGGGSISFRIEPL